MRWLIVVTALLLGVGIGIGVRQTATFAQRPAPTCDELDAATRALRSGVPFGSSCTNAGVWSLEWQSTTITAPTLSEITTKVMAIRTTPAAAYPGYEVFVDAMLECVSGAACDKVATIWDTVNAKKTAEGKPQLTGSSPGRKKVVQTTVTP